MCKILQEQTAYYVLSSYPPPVGRIHAFCCSTSTTGAAEQRETAYKERKCNLTRNDWLSASFKINQSIIKTAWPQQEKITKPTNLQDKMTMM